MTPTIQTARLFLRPICWDDMDTFVDLDSDTEVVRYVHASQPIPKSDYESGLMARMLSFNGEGFGFYSAFFGDHEDPSQFIGWFHLRQSYFDKSFLELGYRFKRKWWSQGFATEGSLALLYRAFSELNVPGVDAAAIEENLASTAVMKKVGMTYIERGQIHPRTDDEVVRYAITRETWQSQRQ